MLAANDQISDHSESSHFPQPIRPFVLSIRHSPSPTPYVLRAWWTSSTGTEAATGCPPDSRRPLPAEGKRLSWPGFLASPGRSPFLPGPLSTPLSCISQPCNGPNGPKGLHSKKPNFHISISRCDCVCPDPSQFICPFQFYAALLQSPITSFSVGSPEPSTTFFLGSPQNS